MTGDAPFTIDRYDIQGRIGAGSMGVVYAGFDPLIGRPVAIKVIRDDLTDEGERELHRARFRHEVKSAGRCIHPGIVTIFDYVERDDNRFIVMEYVEGPVLQQLLAEGPLPPEQGVDIALQVLDALSHAHRQSVVHRDIKPSNIIVGAESRVKITDFGIARLNLGGVTHAGMLVGTPSYMAPEQARGEAVDHRADLFSVGIVFLRMLTGALPYGEGGFVTILQKVAAIEPVDVSLLRSTAPDLAAVADLALAKNPADRFQTADEFARALRLTMAARSTVEIWPGLGGGEALGASLPLAVEASTPAAAARSMDVHGSTEGDGSREPISPALDPSVSGAAQGGGDPTLAEIAGPRETGGGQPTLSDDVLDRAAGLLAYHIGPVSLALVRRLSIDAASLEMLGERLAESIDTPSDRARFQSDFAALGERAGPRKP